MKLTTLILLSVFAVAFSALQIEGRGSYTYYPEGRAYCRQHSWNYKCDGMDIMDGEDDQEPAGGMLRGRRNPFTAGAGIDEDAEEPAGGLPDPRRDLCSTSGYQRYVEFVTKDTLTDCLKNCRGSNCVEKCEEFTDQVTQENYPHYLSCGRAIFFNKICHACDEEDYECYQRVGGLPEFRKTPQCNTDEFKLELLIIIKLHTEIFGRRRLRRLGGTSMPLFSEMETPHRILFSSRNLKKKKDKNRCKKKQKKFLRSCRSGECTTYRKEHQCKWEHDPFCESEFSSACNKQVCEWVDVPVVDHKCYDDKCWAKRPPKKSPC